MIDQYATLYEISQYLLEWYILMDELRSEDGDVDGEDFCSQYSVEYVDSDIITSAVLAALTCIEPTPRLNAVRHSVVAQGNLIDAAILIGLLQEEWS